MSHFNAVAEAKRPSKSLQLATGPDFSHPNFQFDLHFSFSFGRFRFDAMYMCFIAKQELLHFLPEQRPERRGVRTVVLNFHRNTHQPYSHCLTSLGVQRLSVNHFGRVVARESRVLSDFFYFGY